ncbi:hypothetical protein [Aurantiacibacter spongiae]|uniref:Uncharacterized protein n=1 Tax=Aurantiacibacter spongiae TaxID=2488860 RepID=A0A3N5CQ34_9SPHN|nr:hypothetical protein [Aurantiacibacter spongiae]RPF71143.1 hypothetical protein EG799_05600 [Aurantiacibacter spongiae]
MIRPSAMLALSATLAASAAPALAQAAPPPVAGQSSGRSQISLEQRMLMRCSAAFALAHARRQSGEGAAARLPDPGPRGRDFFVRSAARVMDEAGLTREQIAAELAAEARDLARGDTLAQVMPACMGLLAPDIDRQ